MSDRVQVQTPSQRLSDDPVASLAAISGPTADIEQMLAEIESGRFDRISAIHGE